VGHEKGVDVVWTKSRLYNMKNMRGMNTGFRLCWRVSGMSGVVDGVVREWRVPNPEDNRFDLEGY
jgi:hypothetical protein